MVLCKVSGQLCVIGTLDPPGELMVVTCDHSSANEYLSLSLMLVPGDNMDEAVHVSVLQVS